MTSKLLEAVSFAARAHHGKFRKDGKTPYIAHAFRVMIIAMEDLSLEGTLYDEAMLIICLLHDVIEDEEVDFEEITQWFGKDIAKDVADLAKDRRLPKKQREQIYFKTLQRASWRVKIVKMADQIDNLNDCFWMDRKGRERQIKRSTDTMKALKIGLEKDLQRPYGIACKIVADLVKNLKKKRRD
jgi:guanosine-3',5'-bis(diphosphate) 3'-pyrophosphohydrolase